MVLWECNECGETTRERSRRCPSCGTAGTYNRIRTEHGRSREAESLRELWVSAGAERWKPPVLNG